MSNETYIIIIVVCVILSAMFSATETAFSTLNKLRIKALAEKGNKKAKLILKLLDDYNSLITSILIGNNIVNILAASLSTILFVNVINEEYGPTVATVVLTLVVLIFGEITPKAIAKEHPEAYAMFIVRFINVIKMIFTPFNWLFSQWKKLLTKIFKSKDEESMVEEEILTLVKEAEQEGEFNKEESDIIKSAVEFTELEVGDVFTPRIDVTAISLDTSNEEIHKMFLETGYSRVPVYGKEFDDMQGILYYKDFYKAYITNPKANIKEILKPVLYVTANQKINDVLKEFQKKQLHFGLMLDEFGSVAGIVTLEDIVEEIVGEIWDEHDQIENEIVQTGEKEYTVSGKTSIVKLFNLLDLDVDEDFLTVTGWAMHCLEGIPTSGAEFDYEGLHVKVTKANPKRVDTVVVTDNRVEDED